MYAAAKAGVVRMEKTRFGPTPSTVSLRIREPGSALTHFAGLLAVLAAAGPLLMKARASAYARAVPGTAVFLASALFLYAASTLYHTVVLGERATTFFRKIDHVSISLMIAGTYTPVCVTILAGSVGPALLAAIWILAAAGVILKLFWVTCPKFLSSAVYVAMGWLCIFALGPIFDAAGAVNFLWLLFGGIFYTGGAVIYAMHPGNFDSRHIYFGSHEIFHLFVMAGSLCHFVFLFRIFG